MKYYVGVDIGGSNIRTIFGTDTKILLKLVSPTRKSGPVDTVVSQVIEMIDRGINILQITKTDLFGIGTSSASPFVDGGTRIWTPNISGVGNDWKDIPYMIPLKSHFGEHLVYSLANDCVSSVKAEQLFGAGQGYENLVYVTISTGVGGGIIANNHLVEGKSRNAAHEGHLVVEKGGDLCGCGQRGCIESIASGKAIARRAQERGLANPEGNRLTTKEVFDLYRQGEPTAQALIHETIEYLGMMFSGIISISDPELIIIGGSVFINNKDIIMDRLVDYVMKNSFQAISKGVKFVESELKDFVGDLAGLSLIFPEEITQLWQKLKPWTKTDFPIQEV